MSFQGRRTPPLFGGWRLAPAVQLGSARVGPAVGASCPAKLDAGGARRGGIAARQRRRRAARAWAAQTAATWASGTACVRRRFSPTRPPTGQVRGRLLGTHVVTRATPGRHVPRSSPRDARFARDGWHGCRGALFTNAPGTPARGRVRADDAYVAIDLPNAPDMAPAAFRTQLNYTQVWACAVVPWALGWPPAVAWWSGRINVIRC